MAQSSQTHESEYNYRFADGELVTPEDLIGAPKFVQRHFAWRDRQRLIVPGDEGAPNHKILRPFGLALIPTAAGGTRLTYQVMSPPSSMVSTRSM